MKEEVEEAIYLLIIERRWMEWLCVVEARRCEEVLLKAYKAMVEIVKGSRQQDLNKGAGDKLVEWMMHEWDKHARLRQTQDIEKALARLQEPRTVFTLTLSHLEDQT